MSDALIGLGAYSDFSSVDLFGTEVTSVLLSFFFYALAGF